MEPDFLRFRDQNPFEYQISSRTEEPKLFFHSTYARDQCITLKICDMRLLLMLITTMLYGFLVLLSWLLRLKKGGDFHTDHFQFSFKFIQFSHKSPSIFIQIHSIFTQITFNFHSNSFNFHTDHLQFSFKFIQFSHRSPSIFIQIHSIFTQITFNFHSNSFIRWHKIEAKRCLLSSIVLHATYKQHCKYLDIGNQQ